MNLGQDLNNHAEKHLRVWCKYTPLYKKDTKQNQNKPMETTTTIIFRFAQLKPVVTNDTC